ncbi:MAG: ferritin-like domain-containing protein [Actinomycetota bacterium]|nr:ferritin-like domain-containing protein [Actinomycetota bacterium]
MAPEDLASEADDASEAPVPAIIEVDPPERVHSVASGAATLMTWEYGSTRAGLASLYERAKSNQWNGRTDLPWETEVDQESVVRANADRVGGLALDLDVTGTPAERWGDPEWLRFGVESQNWTMSQFLHGEQGALVCAAKIVESVPWIDAKYYAATQVMDEARHVEVFSRYLDTKLSGRYPVNAQLQMLLDDVIADSRWDLTYLGMQVMLEGLGLAAFALIQEQTTEPLLRRLLDYVIADEARHMAFGVISLRDVYADLSEPEIRDRQEFAFESVLGIRDRILQQEVWERMGVPARVAVPLVRQSPEHHALNAKLFARIVPACSTIGLLDAGDGWLRRRFDELGVLQYERPNDEMAATSGACGP